MSIAQNKKARFDYFIEENYESGLVLEGWEVKAIRAGRAQINEAYVILRDGAFWLLNAHIAALPTASTHITTVPTRTRKLLLKAEEIRRLIGKVEQRGYALVPLDLHYKNGRIKLEIGLGKGKLKGDKRETEKKRDWVRERQRLVKTSTR
jgi:SsrA-binding protein